MQAFPALDAPAVTSRSSGPVAVLRHVHARVERQPVLRGVDLRLEPGEVLGLSGANGSGKSTLLRLLATLLPPAAGSAQVLGADLCRPQRATVRPRIALVGHEPALYGALTLQENLALLLRLTGAGAQARSRALAALEAVGLGDAAERRADRCSQGMRRRADLARVLLGRPALLLLDEVHTGLDASAVPIVDALLAGVRADSGGAVLVAHDAARLAACCDRVVTLTDGRLAPTPSRS